MGMAGNNDIEFFYPGFPKIIGDGITYIIGTGVNEEVFTFVLDKSGITVADVYEVDSKISGREGREEKEERMIRKRNCIRKCWMGEGKGVMWI